MGTRDRARPGHSLTAADDAGHRCRVVRVTVGRSGDQLVREIEASKRVHRRDLERVVDVKIRKQARNSFGQHGLADARRPVEEQVVPAGRGYLAGPLGLDLTNHICQVETTLACLPARSPITSIGSTNGIGLPSQECDQLSDRSNTEHVDPFDQLRLSGLS